MRKRYDVRGLYIAVMVVLVFALAACGSANVEPGDNGTNVKPEGSSNEEAGQNAAETRLFTDDLGRNVEIPVSPQKVVVCEFSPEALTVGVQPAAVCDNDSRNSFTQASLEGIDSVGDPPNAEKIVTISPDLMVFSAIYPQIYPEVMEQLEKIAPVVYVEFKDPIYDVFPKVADALGKKELVDDWIKDYEAEAGEAREKLKTAIGDETVSIFRIEKGRLRIYLSTNYGGYVVRSALQANAVDKVKEEIEKDSWRNAVEISLELLPEYVGDHLLVIVGDEDEYQTIQKSALWQGLPAVKNGNVHLLNSDKYYNSDIITIRETMKEVGDMLAPGKSQ